MDDDITGPHIPYVWNSFPCPGPGCKNLVGRHVWFVVTFFDGEISESDFFEVPRPDMFCSEACADAERDTRLSDPPSVDGILQYVVSQYHF